MTNGNGSPDRLQLIAEAARRFRACRRKVFGRVLDPRQFQHTVRALAEVKAEQDRSGELRGGVIINILTQHSRTKSRSAVKHWRDRLVRGTHGHPAGLSVRPHPTIRKERLYSVSEIGLRLIASFGLETVGTEIRSPGRVSWPRISAITERILNEFRQTEQYKFRLTGRQGLNQKETKRLLARWFPAKNVLLRKRNNLVKAGLLTEAFVAGEKVWRDPHPGPFLIERHAEHEARLHAQPELTEQRMLVILGLGPT